jgi:large subunit ribosomal protein L22
VESKAIFKYVRGGPRKIRRVVDLVRGKSALKAIDILSFDRKMHAIDVLKLIKSAISNATQKGGVRPDTLYIKSIMVDQASIMKRVMPRARGSADTIHKKLSHITVVLVEKL